ncbi:MAG: hypothetical protein K6G67_07030 [Lachnospiraceae bacterium]|nr:hypothetical protein [Lachnospiraceae bacterium]
MAYKVSYKVVTEQGEQLKNIAKEMDNYVNRINQITSKLGSDELLQQVRSDLNKFKQQLEEEKTVLNLAGQVITDVVQNYTGAEKKSVGKVDKAKAHNRDFYKRPVAVASAGGGAAAGAAGAAGASFTSSSVNVGSVTNSQTITNTTNMYGSSTGAAAGVAGTAATAATTAAKELTGKGASMIGGIAAAVGSVAAAGGAVAGADLIEKKKATKKKSEA